jgi:hypothetical protein
MLQVMGMPGMVTSIVESLKYLTPFAFDVLTFGVLKQLASPKKKVKVTAVDPLLLLLGTFCACCVVLPLSRVAASHGHAVASWFQFSSAFHLTPAPQHHSSNTRHPPARHTTHVIHRLIT